MSNTGLRNNRQNSVPRVTENDSENVSECTNSVYISKAITLPIFDPSVGAIEAHEWISEVDKLSSKNKWDDNETIARSVPFLAGLAKELYTEWTPTERTWPALKEDLQNTFPKCRDLHRDFKTAANMTSEQYSTVSIYAVNKHRILKKLRLQFRESEILELITGGITDPYAKSIATSAETITGLYQKLARFNPLKPISEQDIDADSMPSSSKQLKIETDKRCQRCNRIGHVQSDCRTSVHKLPTNVPAITMARYNSLKPISKQDIDADSMPSSSKQLKLETDKRCQRCNRIGHVQSDCRTSIHKLPTNVPAITMARYNPLKPISEQDIDADSMPSSSKQLKLETEKRCHRCNRIGHEQSDCRTSVHKLPINVPAITMGNKNLSTNKSISRNDKECTFCFNKGHLAYECWTKQRVDRNQQSKDVNTSGKVVRQSQSSEETAVIRERSEQLRETIEEVGKLSADKLAALEQAFLPLAEHFADTHHGLSSWLDDIEKKLQMLAMPALRPEQIVQQQDKNEVIY